MLTAEQFLQRVAALPHGKQLPDALYLHRDALAQLDNGLSRFVDAVGQALKIPADSWNLVKLGRRDFRVSLLHYPTFEQDAYPALQHSITVDLARLRHQRTEYTAHDNPPILHRKEQMVLPDHPLYATFCDITQEGELAGLYDMPRSIGFQQSWQRLIARHGYELVDGRLFRQSMLPEPATDNGHVIDRHKTALVRYELSAPMKQLGLHGYLEGQHSIMDYGCGRGDDLRALQSMGLDALGWDPNHYPDGERQVSQIVNLGYVINVIEDPDERIDALLQAWQLTECLLVVSAMLANDAFIARFPAFGDGVITSRNTFQKYYSQSELRGFLERILEESPITVAPGIFYLFRDKCEEQRFLQRRYRRRTQWQPLLPERRPRSSAQDALRLQHAMLLEEFWARCLSLGRLPLADEFAGHATLLAQIGSPRQALRLIATEAHHQQLATARQARMDDLLVFLALTLFEKRRPYTQLDEGLKLDIKAFWGDYRSALSDAKNLLYAIADIQQLETACQQAHDSLPASLLFAGHSLLLPKEALNELPALLRVYVGAACQLFGELDSIQVIKVHIQSGKVSLLGYDDFSQPIPYLVERIKIRMAEQEVDFFDYVEPHRRPPLLNKSYLMPPDHPDFSKQRSLEQRLGKLFGLDLQQDLNLSRGEFEAGLAKAGKVIKSYRLCNKET